MSIKKRDWIFLALVLAVFGIFIAISGEEKTTRLPQDQIHLKYYDMLDAGKKRIEVDALCAECHDGVKIAFPEKHPAKPGQGVMRCLFCHKQGKRIK